MNRNENPTRQRPMAAFVLALLAGLIMLLSERMLIVTGQMAQPASRRGIHWLWGTTMMHSHGGPVLWNIVGVFAGAMVLIGSFVIYMRPGRGKQWGLIIALASALAVLAGAGGALAGTLGIAAGILAIIWKPRPA